MKLQNADLSKMITRCICLLILFISFSQSVPKKHIHCYVCSQKQEDCIMESGQMLVQRNCRVCLKIIQEDSMGNAIIPLRMCGNDASECNDLEKLYIPGICIHCASNLCNSSSRLGNINILFVMFGFFELSQ